MALAFTTFEPLHDRFLIELGQRADKVGNIHVPDKFQEVQCKGTVRAHGKDTHTVEDGKVVHFYPKRGTRFQHDGKEWLVLHQNDLVAIEEAAS